MLRYVITCKINAAYIVFSTNYYRLFGYAHSNFTKIRRNEAIHEHVIEKIYLEMNTKPVDFRTKKKLTTQNFNENWLSSYEKFKGIGEKRKEIMMLELQYKIFCQDNNEFFSTKTIHYKR